MSIGVIVFNHVRRLCMYDFSPPTKCQLVKSFFKSDLEKLLFLSKKIILNKPYKLYDPDELKVPDRIKCIRLLLETE